MAKIRLQITKGEAVRYISHLDYARAIERAVRRAKLPVAYSEGFNPHMKMAFASALTLGVTSDAEYMDIELAETMDADRFKAALSAQLPPGIALTAALSIEQQTPALMKVVNLGTYTVRVPLTDGDYDRTARTVEAFNAADEVLYIKESPKGRREINIKKFLADEITISGWDAITAQLQFAVHITPTGSVKPGEVIDALTKDYGLPVKQESAVIHRTGLFINDGRTRLSPIKV